MCVCALMHTPLAMISSCPLHTSEHMASSIHYLFCLSVYSVSTNIILLSAILCDLLRRFLQDATATVNVHRLKEVVWEVEHEGVVNEDRD